MCGQRWPESKTGAASNVMRQKTRRKKRLTQPSRSRWSGRARRRVRRAEELRQLRIDGRGMGPGARSRRAAVAGAAAQ